MKGDLRVSIGKSLSVKISEGCAFSLTPQTDAKRQQGKSNEFRS